MIDIQKIEGEANDLAASILYRIEFKEFIERVASKFFMSKDAIHLHAQLQKAAVEAKTSKNAFLKLMQKAHNSSIEELECFLQYFIAAL